MPTTHFSKGEIEGAILNLADLRPQCLLTRLAQGISDPVIKELDLVRRPGGRRSRPLSETTFYRLFDPSQPTVGFGPGSISGRGLIAMAAQVRRMTGGPSFNVIEIVEPIADVYERSDSDGTVTLYALRGSLVDSLGTVYYGEFPEPVRVDLLDGASLTRSCNDRSSRFLATLPLLNPADVVEALDKKAHQKSILSPLGEEFGVLVPDHVFLTHEQIGSIDDHPDTRNKTLKFIENSCPDGVAIKPNTGSIGNGVTLTFDNKLPDDLKPIKDADRGDNGVIVEERIASVPFCREGTRYDWNLRVLVTPDGIVDLEVRYDKIGGPVNISRGASAREFSSEFIKCLDPSPSSAGQFRRKVLDRLDQFGRAVCKTTGAGYVGMDIILSHETLYSRTDKRPPSIGEGFFLACNEINVGAVGGQSTLARIRRRPETKLKASDRWIDLSVGGITVAPEREVPKEKLVQLSKHLAPERIVAEVFKKDLKELSDAEFLELCKATIHILSEDLWTLSAEGVRLILSQFQHRELGDFPHAFAAQLSSLSSDKQDLRFPAAIILRQVSPSSDLCVPVKDLHSEHCNAQSISNIKLCLEVDRDLAIDVIASRDLVLAKSDRPYLRNHVSSAVRWMLAFAQYGDLEMVEVAIHQGFEMVTQAFETVSREYREQVNNEQHQESSPSEVRSSGNLLSLSMSKMSKVQLLTASLPLIVEAADILARSQDLKVRTKYLEAFSLLLDDQILMRLDIGRVRALVRVALFDAYLRKGDFEAAANQYGRLGVTEEDWARICPMLYDDFDVAVLGTFGSNFTADNLSELKSSLSKYGAKNVLNDLGPSIELRDRFYKESLINRAYESLSS